ncbi:hypothetical protein CGMCC3_g6183 [Colletotrichum fructicola]|nr:uncharacterized protein CGMCC3_g6183 [Colletotrichum fructicola]KAE9577887.1 hypothetical protein CGMCC3_g6183 [Colletotrichum fructicola]
MLLRSLDLGLDPFMFTLIHTEGEYMPSAKLQPSSHAVWRQTEYTVQTQGGCESCLLAAPTMETATHSCQLQLLAAGYRFLVCLIENATLLPRSLTRHLADLAAISTFISDVI